MGFYFSSYGPRPRLSSVWSLLCPLSFDTPMSSATHVPLCPVCLAPFFFNGECWRLEPLHILLLVWLHVDGLGYVQFVRGLRQKNNIHVQFIKPQRNTPSLLLVTDLSKQHLLNLTFVILLPPPLPPKQSWGEGLGSNICSGACVSTLFRGEGGGRDLGTGAPPRPGVA